MTVIWGCRWVAGSLGPLGGGLELRGVALGVAERLLRDVAFLAAMTLDREDDEHEREDAEDEGLDRVEHQLKPDHQDRDDGERQGRDDPQRDLAAVDVAEESHRQRDGLDELEHQLDQPDEQRDDSRSEAVLELVEREELAEVAADAERPE